MTSAARTTPAPRRGDSNRRRPERSSAWARVAFACCSFLAFSCSGRRTMPCAVDAFAAPRSSPAARGQSQHRISGRRTRFVAPSSGRNEGRRKGGGRGESTALAFMGSDGGILGVGAPEVALILVVGYFILGAEDLYKLAKEVGKFIQNFQTLGAEATKSFENTMEDQLEITELRKVQQELNDAFNFRRSINTDDSSPGFMDTDMAANANANAAVAATATPTIAEDAAPAKKKKRRLVKRRKKKAVEVLAEIPDLDMSDMFPDEVPDLTATDLPESDDAESRRKERLGRLEASVPSDEPDWYKASEEEIADEVLGQQQSGTFEQDRFATQLSGKWNEQVTENEDKLGPLAMVMERLAILEAEKQAVDKRLEEEFERRMANEDRFYLEKRAALEETAATVQTEAYMDMTNGEKSAETSNSAATTTKFSV